MIKARIGIVSWNTAGPLDECLASLDLATAGMDAEVVVVDNASSDDSVVVCRRRGIAVIRNETNEGYARAMNVALSAGAQPQDVDVLIALNPDTVCPPRSLTILAQQLLAEADVGLVAPRLGNLDGTTQHSVYRFPSVAVSIAAAFLPMRMLNSRIGRQMWLEGSKPPDQPCEIDWAIGAVHVMRPSALAGSSPYSERWFMYVEDLDLCWQMAQGGWRRVLHPEVDVVHIGNAAGAQAWGSDRIKRWLRATYDWYRLRKGAFAARRWAAANTVGVLFRLALTLFRKVLGRPVRAWERDLRLALPIHVEAMVGRSGVSMDPPGNPAPAQTAR
jgi:GT2 family glycosyltransferase